MSHTRQLTIWCNGEDCFAWEYGEYTSVTKSRKLLKQRGWSHKGEDDFCPACTKEREGVETNDN